MFSHHRVSLPHLTEAEEATYDAEMIEVKLRNLPSNFPVQLANALESSYNSTFLAHMSGLHNGKQTNPDSKESFSIVTALRNRRISGKFTFLTHETGLTSAILANYELLKWYHRSALVRSPEIMEFFEIATEDGVENPQLNQMLSLKVLNMGWGFDTHGCLSFYRCQNEWGNKAEYVVYVKRDTPEKGPDHAVVVID
jgi:hypothetical protein